MSAFCVSVARGLLTSWQSDKQKIVRYELLYTYAFTDLRVDRIFGEGFYIVENYWFFRLVPLLFVNLGLKMRIVRAFD